jgi:hypothetical protein
MHPQETSRQINDGKKTFKDKRLHTFFSFGFFTIPKNINYLMGKKFKDLCSLKDPWINSEKRKTRRDQM